MANSDGGVLGVILGEKAGADIVWWVPSIGGAMKRNSFSDEHRYTV
jgi:hypothetical protein